jgi:mRNA interferase MazF
MTRRDSTSGDQLNNRIPEAGDIIWLYIGPGKGNEQDGFRPFLVITDADTNDLTGRVVGLPITSSIRGWETEIPITSLPKPGVALVDQIKSLAYRQREFKFLDEQATQEELASAKFAIKAFLQL